MTAWSSDGDSSFTNGDVAADFKIIGTAQLNKVTNVRYQVETDEVSVHEPPQHLIPPWKLAVDFWRWERNMQEEPDGEIRAQLAQDPRNELQLIILHPHRCAVCCNRCYLGGKT